MVWDNNKIIKKIWTQTPMFMRPLANNSATRLLCGLLLFGGPRYYSHYKWLLKTQWWTVNKMEEYRFNLFKKVLKHSYKNVPYYKNLYQKKSINPEHINGLRDLEKLPIITKNEVFKNYENFFSKKVNKRNLKTNLTGGSTGTPLKVNYDKYFWAHASATERFIKRLAGFDDFSLRVSIPGNGPFYKMADNFFEYNDVTRQLFFSSVIISDKIFKRYAGIIKKFKPRYFDAHPSIIYYFAKFLNENNINDITFDSILCSGEVLYDFQRKLIEKQFGCKIFNYYGHNELLCLAAECEKHSGMHINEIGLVEVVDKDGEQVKPGKKGEIIATTLYNYAWPLIRYNTGDIGKIETKPCSCGRGLLKLKEVYGRFNDTIRLPDGEIIPPTYFTTIMDKFLFAKQFQFIQEDEKNLILKIIKKDKVNKKEIKRLENHLIRITNNKINICIEFVDFINRFGRKNKCRYIISKVK